MKNYLIKRGGVFARNLSEGEKMAIAFSYFIVKSEEKNCKISETIFFIDDPISSFDSNFVYHCFSLIKSHFNESKQLFVSTHNFQFFNLVKKWFINKNKHKKEGRKDKIYEFYMVENFIENNFRKAEIKILDKTLQRFYSEYHFLFDLLYNFRDNNPQYAALYTAGNIARRFFEIFSDFKIPSLNNQKEKLEKLVRSANHSEQNKVITDTDVSKVYDLINDFSHNSDPTSIIEHKDKREILEAIEILLKLIKLSDPLHFSSLEESI